MNQDVCDVSSWGTNKGCANQAVAGGELWEGLEQSEACPLAKKRGVILCRGGHSLGQAAFVIQRRAWVPPIEEGHGLERMLREEVRKILVKACL